MVSAAATPLIFDGHNDLLLKLHRAGGPDAVETYFGGRDGHLDAAKVREGGFGGGFFAVYVPSDTPLHVKMEEMQNPTYDLPLPDPIPQDEALPVVFSQVAILRRLETRGALRICRSTADIRACFDVGVTAAVFHIEGAEAIDADLLALETFHAAGLRSLGPVWSRETLFGHGVPFRFPADPDTGPGLTDAGRRLVRRCNELGILIDLSHLNEAGFWDVARLSDAPLVATHSNAHAITPHSRNLTDRQLDAIRDSDGMVGLNFAVAFLREDGRMIGDTPLAQMLRHLDTLIARLGESRVGMGSDFDGAVVPETLESAAGLPRLRQAMADHGYDADLIARLCHGNWLRVLEKTWGG